jgi:hypothetical protein
MIGSIFPRIFLNCSRTQVHGTILRYPYMNCQRKNNRYDGYLNQLINAYNNNHFLIFQNILMTTNKFIVKLIEMMNVIDHLCSNFHILSTGAMMARNWKFLMYNSF